MEIVLIPLIGFALYLGLQNQSRLAALHRRIEQLEAGAPAKPKADTPKPAAPAPAPAAPSAPPPPPVRAAARSASDGPPVATPAGPKPSLEERLGTRWTVWVGGLSLALGGIFLVKYSIEAGLLGPGARI